MKIPKKAAGKAKTKGSAHIAVRELSMLAIPQLLGLLDELEGRIRSP